MEFRQLTYAVQIAREKNFSRAAEKLHIAQPSLSQQIAKLEQEIGVLLFRRSTNSVELTHAGSLFMERAQAIIDMVEQLKQEMDDISQMRKGKLVIGSLPITGSHILPLVLPVFKENNPYIEVSLLEETTTNLETLTAGGQTDLSLLTLPLQDAMLATLPLTEEEICLAVPPEHPLAKTAKTAASGGNPDAQANHGDGGLKLESLRDEPFILLKKGQGFRQITLDLCKEAGFEPRIVFESSNIETVQSLVAAGMGIALVPKMVTRGGDSDLAPVYLRFAEPRPSRTLVVAYRKGRYLSKAAQAFIATIESIFQHHGH